MIEVIKEVKSENSKSEFYPVDKSKLVKIDLASGINYYKGENNDEIDEWLHVDGDKADHVEVVCDFSKGISIETGIADMVHCSEFLEHIPLWQENQIMSEFNRIMKIGCHFFGSCPNLMYTCEEFAAGRMNFWYANRNLYGDGAGYYHTHYRLFTPEELTKFLEKWGFGEIDLSKSPGLPGTPFWLVFECKKVRSV